MSEPPTEQRAAEAEDRPAQRSHHETHGNVQRRLTGHNVSNAADATADGSSQRSAERPRDQSI